MIPPDPNPQDIPTSSAKGYRANAGGSLKMGRIRPAALKVDIDVAQDYGKDRLPELKTEPSFERMRKRAGRGREERRKKNTNSDDATRRLWFWPWGS